MARMEPCRWTCHWMFLFNCWANILSVCKYSDSVLVVVSWREKRTGSWRLLHGHLVLQITWKNVWALAPLPDLPACISSFTAVITVLTACAHLSPQLPTGSSPVHNRLRILLWVSDMNYLSKPRALPWFQFRGKTDLGSCTALMQPSSLRNNDFPSRRKHFFAQISKTSFS